jgi:hypothetical protein
VEVPEIVEVCEEEPDMVDVCEEEVLAVQELVDDWENVEMGGEEDGFAVNVPAT